MDANRSGKNAAQINALEIRRHLQPLIQFAWLL
jgi:hypothetical protein